MSQRRIRHISITAPVLLILLSFLWSSCDSTKHLKENEYLLRKNSIELKSDGRVKRKDEIKDNLQRIIVQKPNSYTLWWPTKVWLYNIRYKKYEKDTTNFQIKSKTVEKPVVYDSTTRRRTMQNMKSYMVNQGYFYARIKDTTKFRGKKAYVTYTVETGINYLLNNVILDIDDSAIVDIIRNSSKESLLVHDKEFSMSQLEAERSRITNLLKNNGYYKFSQESISFVIDTQNKAELQNAYSPFESAVTSINQKAKKPPLDVIVVIRAEDPAEYRKYYINNITVVPDYEDRKDMRDSTMIVKNIEGTVFRYHHYYVRSRVILKHIYFEKGKLFSQADYDQTQTKLTELGVFQTINIRFRDAREDSTVNNLLNCNILMNRAKKYDFSTNYEVSSGSTYFLGNTLSFSYRNKNLGKGANLLNISLSGGLETSYNETIADNVFDRFSLLNRYYGINTSINFPKFIVPFKLKNTRRNLPRTIISLGTNFQDRINYFSLTNTTSSITYNFRETREKIWDVSPAFVNIIRLPSTSDSFQARLDTNEFLRNSYRPTFIEGENIAFTFSNQEKKKGGSYSYLRLAFEEAGGLMQGINALIPSIDSSYSQYTKYDFDARHYFKRRHSTAAFRLYGGIGLPYGQSTTLPYIKQYYAGGAYSIRGWRIRSLGPGTFYDSSAQNTTTSFVDRTGDIKLEMNGEYRFDMLALFSGAIKFNGAVFADAGNIWLARKSSSYAGGEFRFSDFGQALAVSTGAGIRMDIAGFFIIRFDAAFPVKKPYAFNGNGGWVFSDIAFGNPTWRSNNIILNIAIGYPF